METDDSGLGGAEAASPAEPAAATNPVVAVHAATPDAVVVVPVAPPRALLSESARDDASVTASEEAHAAVLPSEPVVVDPCAPTPLDHIEVIVRHAAAAHGYWAKLTLRQRIVAIRQVKRRLLQRASEISVLLQDEVGKPVVQTLFGEILPSADVVDYWCDVVEDLTEEAPVELDGTRYPNKSGVIRYDALGVVAVITPWTDPIAIPFRSIIPALLVGNAVVFKPSERAPRSGALIESLFAGLLPPGTLSVVQGGAEAGRALVRSHVDAVVLTGSVEVGRDANVACAHRFIPCSLHLAGKDAAIVLRDCDVERAARGIVWGAFASAGQHCAAIERVYVEAQIADPFIARVVQLTAELRPGERPRLIDDEHRARVQQQLEQARRSGVQILTGSAPLAETPAPVVASAVDTTVSEPTVLRVDSHADLPSLDLEVLKDETLGPLLPIMVVGSCGEAIERANDGRYALTTSLWTKNIARARELSRLLRSGTVTINNHGVTAMIPQMPWTGPGNSGSGVAGSPHGLRGLVQLRAVLEDKGRGNDLWWFPHTPLLTKLAFALARSQGGQSMGSRLAARIAVLICLVRRMWER